MHVLITLLIYETVLVIVNEKNNTLYIKLFTFREI